MAKQVYDENDQMVMDTMQEYSEDMDSVTPQDVKNLCVTGFPADVFDDVLLQNKNKVPVASQIWKSISRIIQKRFLNSTSLVPC